MRVVITIIVALLLLVVGWWLATSLETVEVERPPKMTGEARSNPYHALELFFSELGVTSQSIESAETLFPLPDKDVAILVATQRHGLLHKRANELLEWVESGGHIIVEARAPWTFSLFGDDDEMPTEDRLLKPLDIHASWRGSYNDSDSDETEEEDEPRHTELEPMDFDIDWSSGDWQLVLGDVDPEIMVVDDDQVVFAMFSQGTGYISVAASLTPFNNNYLDESQNAAGFGWLLNQANWPNSVWVVLSDDMPPLSLWAWQRYPTFIVSAFALLILALWAYWPRFGPLTQPQPDEQRSLLAHLRAAGRFYKARGQRLEHARDLRNNLLRTIKQKWPGTNELEQDEHIADASNLDLESVRVALRRPLQDGPQLIHAIQFMQIIRKMF